MHVTVTDSHEANLTAPSDYANVDRFAWERAIRFVRIQERIDLAVDGVEQNAGESSLQQMKQFLSGVRAIREEIDCEPERELIEAAAKEITKIQKDRENALRRIAESLTLKELQGGYRDLLNSIRKAEYFFGSDHWLVKDGKKLARYIRLQKRVSLVYCFSLFKEKRWKEGAKVYVRSCRFEARKFQKFFSRHLRARLQKLPHRAKQKIQREARKREYIKAVLYRAEKMSGEFEFRAATRLAEHAGEIARKYFPVDEKLHESLEIIADRNRESDRFQRVIADLLVKSLPEHPRIQGDPGIENILDFIPEVEGHTRMMLIAGLISRVEKLMCDSGDFEGGMGVLSGA